MSSVMSVFPDHLAPVWFSQRISPITVVPFANLIHLTDRWSEVKQLVYKEKSRRKRTQP